MVKGQTGISRVKDLPMSPMISQTDVMLPNEFPAVNSESGSARGAHGGTPGETWPDIRRSFHQAMIFLVCSLIDTSVPVTSSPGDLPVRHEYSVSILSVSEFVRPVFSVTQVRSNTPFAPSETGTLCTTDFDPNHGKAGLPCEDFRSI